MVTDAGFSVAVNGSWSTVSVFGATTLLSGFDALSALAIARAPASAPARVLEKN